MGEFDDDFGDLYADVEAHASSAINGVDNFTRLSRAPKSNSGTSDDNAVNAKPSSAWHVNSDHNKQSLIGSESNQKVSGLEEFSYHRGSDSEDDLNIVLNDEDCKSTMFPVTGPVIVQNEEDVGDCDFVSEKESKYIRAQGSRFTSKMKAHVYPTMLARGNPDYNVCSQPMGSSYGQITRAHTMPNSAMTRCGYGFSLPWHRSIFDVDIDTFKEKPWMYPGVDITDFFNFGFDEDSWKQYCNSLEQFTCQTFTQSGIPHYDSSKLYQDYGAGSNQKLVHETMNGEVSQVGLEKSSVSPSSRFTDNGKRHSKFPQGRAIQVKDGHTERLPSGDVRRPRDRDSNVVIEITIRDFTEETCNPEGKLSLDQNTAQQESKIEEPGANDNKWIPSSCGQGDELSVESLDEDVRGSERSSPKTTSSSPMTVDVDVDVHRNDQSTDVFRNHHKEMSSVSPEGTIESKKSFGRDDSSKVGPCMKETELSLDDEVQLSLTSSSFGSDSAASMDSIYCNHEVTTPVRVSSMNSGPELHHHIGSCLEKSKGNDVKRKSNKFKDYSKCTSPERKEWKHQSRNAAEMKQKRHCRTPVGKGRKHHISSHDSLLPSKSKMVYEIDVSTASDPEELKDWDHLAFDYKGPKTKLQTFDSSIVENRVCYEEVNFSHHYGGRKFAENQFDSVHQNYPGRKRSLKFHNEVEPYVRRNWKGGYLCEDGQRNKYLCERGLWSTKRNLSHSSDIVEKEDLQLEIQQFRKPSNHCSQFVGYKNDYDFDFVEEDYAQPVLLTGRQRDSLDKSYGRQLPSIRKEFKNSGRSRFDNRVRMEMDSSHFLETEDEFCWKMDNIYLFHQPCRGMHKIGGLGPISPRKDYFDLRLTRKCWSHERQFFGEEDKETGFHNHDEIEDDIDYHNDQGELWNRDRSKKLNHKLDIQYWTKEEIAVGHPDYKFSSSQSSFTCKSHRRRERIHAKVGSSIGMMRVDHVSSQQHRIKAIRGGSNANSINKISKIYRGEHEETDLRCRDLVDLIVGERKFPKCIKDRNIKRDGGLENIDRENCNESSREKAIRPDLSKVDLNNNKKWHHKFPTLHEEGLIVAEEQYTSSSTERNHVSGLALLENDVKARDLKCDTVSSGRMVVTACDNVRILEILAKMEKRRERFKEPITLKREQEKCSEPEVSNVDTEENKQQKPARKRRWCGS